MKKVRVIWYLTNNRQINRIGLGAQQIFATLSREERWAITIDCLRVREHPIY